MASFENILSDEEQANFLELVDENDLLKSFNNVICSGNTKFFDSLTKYTEIDGNAIVLKNLLSEVYSELKLRNVSLSSAMEQHVEQKLIELQFFYKKDTTNKDEIKISLDDAKTRIELTCQLIEKMLSKYSVNVCEIFPEPLWDVVPQKGIDGEFHLLGCFIAQNIHILKRQLKGTYTKLPWEEIEFLLVCFMTSLKKPEDSDVIYKLVLDREIILKHLNNFRIKLNEVKQGLKEKDVHFKEKLGGRGKMVSAIIRETPDFEDLYRQHDILKSVYSLKRINISVALSFNANDKVGHVETLVLERTLQVIGESFKNTPDSPNVSEQVHNIFSQEAPRHARELSTALRDCLSHSHSFTRRPMQDAIFCLNLQADLKKINKQIQYILYAMKIEATKFFLKKILKSKRIEEVHDIVRSLIGHQFEESLNVISTDITEESFLLKQLLEEFKKIVADKTGVAILFQEAEEILDWHENNLTEMKTKYLENINQVKNLVNLSESNSSCFQDIKDVAELCLDTMSPDKMTQSKLKRFINVISAIGLTVLQRSDAEVVETNNSLKLKHIKLERIVYEMYAVVEFTAGRISGINQFKNKIGKGEGEDDENEANELVDQTFKGILDVVEVENDKIKFQKDFENCKRIYKAKKVLVKIFDSKVKGKDCDFTEAVKNLKLKARNANKLQMFYENDDFVQCKELVQKLEDHYGQFAKTIEELSLFSQETYKKNISTFFQSFKLKENAKKNLMEIVDRHIGKREEEIAKYFNSRLKVLETLLLNEDSPEKRTVSHNIAVEMLTLELTEILENLKFFGDGKLFLDQNCPLLIGKNLRNYLAHGDALIDSLPFQPSTAIDYCAKLLVKTGGDLLTNRDISIGRSIETDFQNLNKIYERGFEIVCQQDEMFTAIKQNDLEGVKYCVLNGADPRRANVSGWNGLHFAASSGNITLLEYFLGNDLSLETKDIYGKTPLRIAYINDRIDLIQYIIDNQFIVSKDIDIDGANFLHLAARLGRADIISGMQNDIDNVDKGNICKQTALHLSCQGGHADVICILLDMGASIFVDSTFGEKPLHYAAQNGHERVIQIMLDKGADPVAASYDGWTSLHYAAYHGHLNVVKTILEHLCNTGSSLCGFIDAPTDKKMRALHLAVKSGHRDIVEVLLDYKCSVSFKDCFNMTALHYAYSGGHSTIIELLVNARATLIGTDENDSWKNIHLAAMHGHADVLEQLLRGGNSAGDADPENGYTALHRAAALGNLEVLRLLLKYKAPICAKAYNGCTALHLAVRYNHSDAVQMLIKHAAQIKNRKTKHQNNMSDLVDATNEDYSTALHIAVAMEHEICVRHLIDGGANINAKDLTGCSALHIGARYGVTNILNILIDGGCDLNAVSKDNWSAIHFAADNGHFDAVKLLIEKESKLDILSSNNETILHCAVAKDFRNIVQLILNSIKKEDRKSLINTRQGENKQTVLHFAVKNGLKEVTTMLLENEADTEILDCEDNSALVFAAITGHIDILSELLAKEVRIKSKEEFTNFDDISIENKGAILNAEDGSIKTEERGVNAEGLSIKGKEGSVRTKKNVEQVSTNNKGRITATKIGAVNDEGISVNKEGSINTEDLSVIDSVDQDSSIANRERIVNVENKSVKIKKRTVISEEVSVKNKEGSINTVDPSVVDSLNLEVSSSVTNEGITNVEDTFETKEGSGAAECASLKTMELIPIAKETSIETNEEFVSAKFTVNKDETLNAKDTPIKIKERSINTEGTSIKIKELIPNVEETSVNTKEEVVNTNSISIIIKEEILNTKDTFVKIKKGSVNTKELSDKDSINAEKASINAIAAPIYATVSHMNIPVCLAAGNGHLEALKLLMNAGANLNSCDVKGNTALHWAVKNRRVEVVEFLMKKGIDADLANKDGLTPFHLAAQTSCKTIVKILLLSRKNKTSLRKDN